ncbi:MAG: ankyrin repeat domain-containing protein [Candidatus Omnitrophota bacterium]
MKNIFVIFLLIMVFPLLNARDRKLFNDDKCREAYLYHFLNRSCSCGDEIGVRILLSQGADPNGKDYKNYADCVGPFEFSSPLFVSVSVGNIEIAKMLLNVGANPNILEGEGVTPLVEAVEKENVELVQLLLKHGAKVDMKGLVYKPLEIAKKKGNIKMIKLLERNLKGKNGLPQEKRPKKHGRI